MTWVMGPALRDWIGSWSLSSIQASCILTYNCLLEWNYQIGYFWTAQDHYDEGTRNGHEKIIWNYVDKVNMNGWFGSYHAGLHIFFSTSFFVVDIFMRLQRCLIRKRCYTFIFSQPNMGRGTSIFIAVSGSRPSLENSLLRPCYW